MNKPILSEHLEQCGFVSWFRRKYPEYFIFAVPNGDKRSISVAKRLKAEGVVAGVPDICIVLPDEKCVWIEMKRTKGGRVSDEQKKIHKTIDGLGHTVIIGKGAKDASDKFENYLLTRSG